MRKLGRKYTKMKKPAVIFCSSMMACASLGTSLIAITPVYGDTSGPLVNGISSFPESYKEGLRKLAEQFPNWKFVPDKTNLDWNKVVERESGYNGNSKINLVHKSQPDEFKSYNSRDYDEASGIHKEYDSNGWIGASKSAVAYYMDPRNFLDPKYVFQFMSVKYGSSVDYRSALDNMVQGSFLNGTIPDSPSNETYCSVLLRTGQKIGVNPLVLAAMIMQEQGKSGYGNSITGLVSGFEGLYNYFNIGAVRGDGFDAVENGLAYARQRGWTNRTKSIEEGASYFADKYVKKNQDTLYLKKFNVMNGENSVGTWQYMTNVAGAASEGYRMSEAFNGHDAADLLFEIPVYENMPEQRAPKPSVSEKPRWVNEGNQWKYMTGNSYVTSKWLKISGYWYYFNNEGYAVRGWQQLDSQKYYFNSDCQMVTGTVNIEGKQYIFDAVNGHLIKEVPADKQEENVADKTNENSVDKKEEHNVDKQENKADKQDNKADKQENKADGNQNENNKDVLEKPVEKPVANGWFQADGGKWYFGRNHKKATGWLKDGNKWYYLNSSGVMLTGWVKDSNTWYYLDSSGAMVTGWLKNGNTWYYLNSSGAMATGWIKDGNTWYYMDNSGAMSTGWVQDGANRYYMSSSGAMVTGWVKDGNLWHYMGSSGAMAKGWIKDGNTWYYMDDAGTMATGWVQDGANRYYMSSSGAMVIGWIKEGTSWHYMGSSGAMAKGWIKDGNTWYYMDNAGTMVTGWIQDGSNHYYMSSSGAMVTGWLKDGDSWYYMGSSGAMATGWVKDGNYWYYMNSSGVMLTGTHNIAGTTYSFNSSGVWIG